MALRNAFEAIATEATLEQVRDRLPTSGSASEETLAALAALSDEVKSLNETMLILLQAILEKMPRVTGNDQVAVSIEAGSVGIATNQTLATVGTLNAIGGRYVPGDNVSSAGLTSIYNNLVIT